MPSRRLAICIVLSALLHWSIGRALQAMPPLQDAPKNVVIEVRMDEKLPPPPDPEPEPPKPDPPPKAPDVPQVLPAEIKKTTKPPPKVAKLVVNAPAKDAPPSDRAVDSSDATAEPTFGISMESTAPGAGGPAVPVGNTTQSPSAGPAPDKVKPLSVPTAVAEVTKMPMMRDRCEGKYTDEAREAGIEGTVVLEVTVDGEGATRDISVVKGLGHGLDESAIETLKRCRFSPGERNGEPVTVRVRAFKIRYYLPVD